MTKRTDISPRIKPKSAVAKRLGICVATFDKRLPDLREQGFPLYDDLLGGYDMKAIDDWLDRRSGILGTSLRSADDALDEWSRRHAG